MRRFLLFCSGAAPGLDLADEPRRVGIGATVLLTAGLAALSGGYALFTVFRSVPAAAAVGVLWGVVVFNLDRLVCLGMRRRKTFALDLLCAAPHLAFTILLALVVARPLEMRLFEAEIEQRWMQMQVEGRRGDLAEVLAADGERLEGLRGENARLAEEVEDRRREHWAAEDAWIREKEGVGGTGLPGAGPAFREKDEARREAERRMREVESRNLPLIERNDREILRLRDEQESRIERMDRAREGANGFLARLEALGALKRESRTIHGAGVLITLLFVSLQTAPVVVNLLAVLSPLRTDEEPLEGSGQSDPQSG